MALPVLPSAAQAQPGVFVDPETPAGKEYAIPLEEARRQATGDERGSSGGRAGGQPLFGAGIERAPSPSGADIGAARDGGGKSGAGPRDNRDNSGQQGDGEPPGAGEPPSGGAGSMALEATVSDGSAALATAGIAGLVLAGGLAVGFGLRRLLRNE